MATKKANEGTPEPTIFERLAEPFPHDVVEWRADQIAASGKSAMALCYIDARSVMARLDEVVGPQNWQDRYREEGGRIICTLSLRIEGEWIAKEDGAGDTNFEGEKGAVSGALKRCAVKWGIGRYLYDIDALWAACEPRMRNGEMVKNQKGKPVFQNWTDAGQRMLDEALRRAPGPRQTGRPFSVDKTIEQFRAAKTIDELAKAYTAHWATIPLAYRKEVLEVKEACKQTLQSKVRNNVDMEKQ
jgi:hypothetical protein